MQDGSQNIPVGSCRGAKPRTRNSKRRAAASLSRSWSRRTRRNLSSIL